MEHLLQDHYFLSKLYILFNKYFRHSLIFFLMNYHVIAHNMQLITVFTYRFTKDTQTFAIDRQFMWGLGLLLSPVLTQVSETKMKTLFP